MRRIRSRIAIALLFVFSWGCKTNETISPTVAEVNGVVISEADVDDWIRDELFRQRFEGKNESEMFEMRSAALDRMIEDEVVQSESRRDDVSREELIARELEAIGPVPDSDVQAFFDENETRFPGAPFEQVAPHIRQHLESVREKEAIAAIRERAEVEVFLVRPRFEIDAVGPSRGPADAPVTIVEFSDFECPYCERAVKTIQAVLERYPDDVRLVYRHLPLDSIHKRARPAAEAAACADAQQKFWPYHDLLFANNKKLADEDLRGYAEELELDLERFDACVGGRELRELVQNDASVARKNGVNGTPAFFVNGILLSGARPPNDFFRVIDDELARASESGS